MVSNTNMVMHYRGMSKDTKPEGVPNGSDFFEMDSGKTWYYDAEGGEWCDPTAADEADNDNA